MKTYLKILSVFYMIGAFLHIQDVLGFRLDFWSLSFVWKIWILFLLLGDSGAALGLWRGERYGIWLFLVIAGSQLFAYTFFASTFGPQYFLIAFHILSLAVYAVLTLRQNIKIKS